MCDGVILDVKPPQEQHLPAKFCHGPEEDESLQTLKWNKQIKIKLGFGTDESSWPAWRRCGMKSHDARVLQMAASAGSFSFCDSLSDSSREERSMTARSPLRSGYVQEGGLGLSAGCSLHS